MPLFPGDDKDTDYPGNRRGPNLTECLDAIKFWHLKEWEWASGTGEEEKIAREIRYYWILTALRERKKR